jgi:hypothetical protein
MGNTDRERSSRTWQRNKRNFHLLPASDKRTTVTSIRGRATLSSFTPNALLATPFSLLSTAAQFESNLSCSEYIKNNLPNFIPPVCFITLFSNIVRNPFLSLSLSLSRASADHYPFLIALCAPPSHHPTESSPMATKTQHPPSTFPRIRFGFGPKHSRSRLLPPEPPEHEDDGDWHIPYNGPYELPPSFPPSKTRDSWGRSLGSALGHVGSAMSPEMGHEWLEGRLASGQTMMSGLPSSGVHSSHPYRMTAATDPAGPTPPTTLTSFPGRGPTSQTLRGGRPSLIATSSTAFANIDTTGGVGESPTPVQRSSPLHTSPPASSRLSFANFLSFGGSTRKSRSDSAHSTRQSSRKLRPRNHSLTIDPLQSNRAIATTATAISDAPRSHSPISLSQAMERGPRQRSHTLIGTSTAAAQTPSPSNDSYSTSFYNRESPLSSHPYAQTFSAFRTEPSRRAPIVISPSASRSMDKGKGVDRSHRYPQPPAPDALSNNRQVPAHLRPASRNSLFKTTSAPNLHDFSRDFSIGKHVPRGKYRWLSPETWCDAMLFPRPRFLEYIDDDPPPQSFNRRQPSPIRPSEATRTTKKHRPLRMALRGSQSAVNLLAPNSASSRGPPRAEPMLMVPRDGRSSSGRPLSFAQDDIALPSPALSLTRLVQFNASCHIIIPASTDFILQGSGDENVFRTRTCSMEGPGSPLNAKFQADQVTRPVTGSVCRAYTGTAEGHGGRGISCHEDASGQSARCPDRSCTYTKRQHTNKVWHISRAHEFVWRTFTRRVEEQGCTTCRDRAVHI